VAVEQFGNLALQSNTVDFAILDSFSPTHSEGRVHYDAERNALRVAGPSITSNLHVGQDEFIYVKNTSGDTIDRVKPVYLVSEDGGIPTIALANAATETTAYVAGLTADQIADGEYGFVQRSGIVFGDTTGLTAGNRIHLGPTAGLLQEAAPTFPYFSTDIGLVLITDATNGCIYIDLIDHFAETFRVTGSAYIDSDLTVAGNLSVLGSESITSVNSLAVANSLMYLNSGDTIGDSATVFIGSGLDDGTLTGHYNGPITETFNVMINSTGTPDTFDWSLDNFTSREAVSVAITGGEQSLANGISVTFEATTGHTIGDEWGGVAAPTQVDTGWVSNRNAGESEPGYTHLGMFFDISDAKFKMFDEYDPEPNASIDTTDGSFSYGDLVLSTLESTVATGTAPFTVASTTLVTNLNADLLDGVQGSVYDTRANASAGFIQLNSNINVVQDNVATLTTTVDNFGTSSNANAAALASDIATLSTVDTATGTETRLNANLDVTNDNVSSLTTTVDNFGTYANTTFSTVSNAEALASGIATKLDSSDYTASDVLTKIKTVDGAGSGLDADLLDGQTSTYFAVEATRSSNAAQLAAGIAAVPEGDIEGVTAGDGLTGGGTSGTVTLNVGAGTGVTVAADTVSIGQAVGTGNSPTFAGLTVTTFDLGAL
jgi:DNA-binding FrmR family transcriptional regulator